MAVLVDYSVDKLSDTSILLEMQPPVPVGGWTVVHTVTKRLGGLSGLIVLSCASGFSGVSGITVSDSGAGRFTLSYQSVYTSGWLPGVYTHATERVMSGQRSTLSKGFLVVAESIGP